MAHISETKSGRYLCRVGVCRSMHPQISRVFDTEKQARQWAALREDARQWAALREDEISRGSSLNLPKKGLNKYSIRTHRHTKRKMTAENFANLMKTMSSKRWQKHFFTYLDMKEKYETKEYRDYVTAKKKFKDVEPIFWSMNR